MGFRQSKALSLAFAIGAAVGILQAQAGRVTLYRNSEFKDKLASLDMYTDLCYNLCYELNNAISSAKWSGLPETTGVEFEEVGSIIEFFADADCNGKSKSWPVSTQSDADLHFPSLFRLDGLNDAISSFRVWIHGGDKIADHCNKEGTALDATNATLNGASGEGSVAVGNDTLGYL
ncbi:hypothetical protein BBJ28_00019549 [Nothophytophthora sp. Chile5]|nr:hypothetical protein BBJ28_00019549 [Nothophytophthora sp. Chile5]